jgi:glucose/arabinose dehydrogenase
MSRTPSHRPRLRLESLEERVVPASLPVGFSETAIASGLNRPTTMQIAPDGKLFILEQAGTAQVWQNGSQVSANFFAGSSLTPSAVDSHGERGLLGIAFDPNYATNHFLYVYYTVNGGSASHNRISRFTANSAGTQVVAGSEHVELDLANLSTATNHNGGAIHFGTDGKLYVAVGDNANGAQSQSLANDFGKILRIDVDGSTLIPSDNPFVNTAGAKGEIWALGFRNPFTFDVRADGVIFVNDVGLNSWEEIDRLVKGANYGWQTTEGPFNQSAFPNFTEPTFAYPHPGVAPAAFTGIAITGGAFYDPATALYPTDYGTGGYFFADYGAGFIKRYDAATGQVRGFASGISAPVDVEVGDDGKLLYLSQGDGKVYAVDFTPPSRGLLADGSVGTASQRFAAGVYHDILGRDLSLGEIRAGILNADAAYIDAAGPAAFVRLIEGSTEARTRLIEDRYQAYLGRAADSGGLGGALAFFQNGGTIEQFEAGILASAEYRADHGNDTSAVVEGWYADLLGRASDAAGKNTFVSGIQNGTLSVDQALAGFLNSAEYRARVVKQDYSTYLGRTAEQAAINAWSARLGMGLRDEDLLALILGDAGHEYFNRVVF